MDAISNILINNKSVFSFLIAIISILLFIFLSKKYKLTKYQILIFLLFVIFWMSIIMVRSYRKVYMMGSPTIGGLGYGEIAAVSVTSIYGLISIFVRLPIFFISDYFKSRKFFILLSILFIGISSFITFLFPTYTTMLMSSLSIGIGASFISLFNVMFAETFTKEKAITSVSILSIAPLCGEFLSAPIQYIFTSGNVKNYNYLWLISTILALIAFISCLFFKDNKAKVRNYTIDKVKEVLKNKTFILLCIMGVVVSFIKFASSGSNFLALVKLNEINMNPLGIAYADVIFSFSQLIAGILVGTYIKKKIGIKKTLLLGFLFTLIFVLVSCFIKNPLVLFFAYSLNGFGYGITYNVLIGLAMEGFEKNYREISMSIFQTFFAIGIYFGDKIYALVFNLFNKKYLFNTYRSTLLFIAGITLMMMALIYGFYKEKNIKRVEI